MSAAVEDAAGGGAETVEESAFLELLRMEEGRASIARRHSKKFDPFRFFRSSSFLDPLGFKRREEARKYKERHGSRQERHAREVLQAVQERQARQARQARRVQQERQARQAGEARWQAREARERANVWHGGSSGTLGRYSRDFSGKVRGPPRTCIYIIMV